MAVKIPQDLNFPLCIQEIKDLHNRAKLKTSFHTAFTKKKMNKKDAHRGLY